MSRICISCFFDLTTIEFLLDLPFVLWPAVIGKECRIDFAASPVQIWNLSCFLLRVTLIPFFHDDLQSFDFKRSVFEVKILFENVLFALYWEKNFWQNHFLVNLKKKLNRRRNKKYIEINLHS